MEFNSGRVVVDIGNKNMKSKKTRKETDIKGSGDKTGKNRSKKKSGSGKKGDEMII